MPRTRAASCGRPRPARRLMVPISFELDGAQYVLVPVGWGSASRLFAPAAAMTTAESKYGPSRLLAFKLGAHNTLPNRRPSPPPVPKPPVLSATSDHVSRGKKLYEAHL